MSSRRQRIERPYLLFLGDAPDALAVKTAQGLVDWCPDDCIGQLRLPDCRADVGLPDLDLSTAVARGAATLVIGVANAGGVLPETWVDTLLTALEVGLDLASGLHRRLSSFPALREAADRSGRRLIDVRHCDRDFAPGNGSKRTGKRLLTVGTDCSVGKKYTALALAREMRLRGMAVDFRATGQTGILIAGEGVAVDAVVADFISGAAEWLTPAAATDHWDVVEGQGSLFHPSFAAVTLGLLHGTQPDAFVVCHEPSRRTMRGVDHPLPQVSEVIATTTAYGRLTNAAIRCVGVAVNTSRLEADAASELLATTEAALRLPCVDPMMDGVGRIVDALTSPPPAH